ncbi:MBL fold metallo-hydrolase [Larsenimonas rhizosphaerae]|uniref:MBL fold metallo-hydrolase n=1 Tax=Larsenimonas rhizosphaerae TaxID=2944682 RepID=A0AA41ZJA4_9GAMM|nr:MBL fold metallo-hydrolase [Larsenimonas rhizosphaerae]MCM2130119.1 MBL fold metallo-hydrolase [Larsenimonas rhizosphaerae]MCX2522806.1 MBL fold metallo-hydrolase [Larsenimonas rhizosphaerae]
MPLSFASLGSGSKGNATLVTSAECRVLVDCGFSLKDIEARLARLDVSPNELDALLITHEHIDHVRGAAALARRYDLPVYATPGTWLKSGLKKLARVSMIAPEQHFSIKDMDIDVVTVPHDARQPVQFILGAGGCHLGLLTDLGHVTSHVLERYRHCDALVLECNHDRDMLQRGPYPPSLKRRVGGHWGHLSNEQAAELIKGIGTEHLQCVVAAHLSDKNNLAELAFEALVPLLGDDTHRLVVADQMHGAGWQSLSRRHAPCS